MSRRRDPTIPELEGSGISEWCLTDMSRTPARLTTILDSVSLTMGAAESHEPWPHENPGETMTNTLIQHQPPQFRATASRPARRGLLWMRALMVPLLVASVFVVSASPTDASGSGTVPGCTAKGGPTWWSATATCGWKCYPGGNQVTVLGGTIGYPRSITGSSGCGAWCWNYSYVCSGIGINYRSAAAVTCSGKNRGVGQVNVAVACSQGYAVPNQGMLPELKLCQAIGTTYHVNAQNFLASSVTACDLVCMPITVMATGVSPAVALNNDTTVDDAYQNTLAAYDSSQTFDTDGCLQIQPNSINMFVGPASYLPVGINCEEGLCGATTWTLE